MGNFDRGQQMRQRIALEAARIMLEEGIKDFFAAKNKAANRLGNPDTRHMPRNSEVEQALMDYQRLFRSDTQPRELRRLRKAALKAMEFLKDFQPRLVGPVLNGTADAYASVNLHVFAETSEELALYLLSKHIPFETAERQLRGPGEKRGLQPVYRFLAGDVTLDLTVFPPTGLRQAPLSPVDGRPMVRATIESVRRLLQD